MSAAVKSSGTATTITTTATKAIMIGGQAGTVAEVGLIDLLISFYAIVIIVFVVVSHANTCCGMANGIAECSSCYDCYHC